MGSSSRFRFWGARAVVQLSRKGQKLNMPIDNHYENIDYENIDPDWHNDEETPSYAGFTSHQAVASSSSQAPTTDFSYQQRGVPDAYNQQPPSYRAAQFSAAGENQGVQLNLSTSAQLKRDHVLRQAVGLARGLDKIQEKIDKGGNPAAQSRIHGQNAFHKAALANTPDVDAVHVLKNALALNPNRLREALNARDRNGQKPADIAAEKAATATTRSERRTFQEMSYQLNPRN
jgi:hypothetical protein